ncbi:5-oxoprolinase subunit PxpB [Kroppenstedtia eburnea]|uniref:Inhibitor of KinA n=1 Tax=Kroppenstedtia eburnea TaxID=714067 RepID=A0A1N7P2U5_9BACL|nr:5-oxoprolinase subunit PxpB [Kroppenstedtia eburnea]QKI80878.1 5-oxoprolinase subunit PxpB [Kroppenstedtia eburnea]SIT04888.1 inhibitor of KinA [Kroppenstedtia eburnea]
MAIKIQPVGDGGLRIGFGERIDPEINREIRSFVNELERNPIPGVVEWVPTYCAVTVYYQPHRIRFRELCQQLEAIGKRRVPVTEEDARVVELPVVYGGEYGPDLESVARKNGLSPQEVIRLHSDPSYRVYMLGFVPGFPYLGGMSERIATPRLKDPRPRIPAGSVGIAGSQTGVYPLETPGGWRIIGRTPVRLYDPDRNPPVLLRAGDLVRFRPIPVETYREMEVKGCEGVEPAAAVCDGMDRRSEQ